MTRKEAALILSVLEYKQYPKSSKEAIKQAIDTAIEALGTTKLKKSPGTDVDKFFQCDVTECCKIGPITTEKFCPECGKKIIRCMMNLQQYVNERTTNIRNKSDITK